MSETSYFPALPPKSTAELLVQTDRELQSANSRIADLEARLDKRTADHDKLFSEVQSLTAERDEARGLFNKACADNKLLLDELRSAKDRQEVAEVKARSEPDTPDSVTVTIEGGGPAEGECDEAEKLGRIGYEAYCNALGDPAESPRWGERTDSMRKLDSIAALAVRDHVRKEEVEPLKKEMELLREWKRAWIVWRDEAIAAMRGGGIADIRAALAKVSHVSAAPTP